MIHLWGDAEMDWKALDEAERYLNDRCRQFARLGLWTKEKYGTLRVSTNVAYFSEYDFIHHIFYPGHVLYYWPKWFRKYIDWPLGNVLKRIGVLHVIQKYQHAVLKYFWKRAAKKWPQVAEEILDEYKWETEQ